MQHPILQDEFNPTRQIVLDQNGQESGGLKFDCITTHKTYEINSIIQKVPCGLTDGVETLR